MRLSTKLAAIAFVALSFFGVSSASAHNIVLKNWCGINAGGPTTLDQFNFTGPQLQQLVDDTIASIRLENMAEDAGEPVPNDNGKCGIVNIDLLSGSGLRASTVEASDDWTKVSIAITFYCGRYSAAGYDVAMPYVPAGSTYSSTTHHTSFHISSGLRGSCIACPVAQGSFIGG